MSSAVFLVIGPCLGVTLDAMPALARLRRRRFDALLKEAEAHVEETGQQKPDLHLTAIAAEVTSSWQLAGDHAFKAEAFLRLALANAKLENLDEMIRLGMAASQEYQRIRPRSGEPFRHCVKKLALLNRDIGLALNTQGQAAFAYEKLKLALDLLGQYLEEKPVLRQASADLRSSLEELPEAKQILCEASKILQSLIQNAVKAGTAEQRFRGALQLIDVLPFDIVDPEDKANILQLLMDVFPGGKPGQAPATHIPSRNARKLLAEANRLFNYGEFFHALLTAHSAFSYALGDGDLYTTAAALGLCGNSCEALGRPSESLVHLWACDAFARLLPAGYTLKAEIAAALGNAFRSLGRTDKALWFLKEGVELAESASPGRTLIVAYLDLARTYLYKHAYKDAGDALAKARKVAGALPWDLGPVDISHLHMVNCLLQLAVLLDNQEQDLLAAPPKEWALLAGSLRAYVGRYSPAWWRWLDSLDEVRQRPERIVARYLKRAWELSITSSDQPSHIAASFYYGLYLEKVDKDPRKAARFFEKAAEVVDTTRGNIVELGNRRSFAGQNSEIYDHLVSCYVQAGDLGRAFATAERARARALFELLQTGLLDGGDFPLNREPTTEPWGAAQIKSTLDRVLLRSRLAGTVARVSRVSVAEVGQFLAPGECLLQFHMLAEETYIFALGPSGITEVFSARYGHRKLGALLQKKEWWKRMDELEKAGSNPRISALELSIVKRRFETTLGDMLRTLSAELIDGARSLQRGIMLEQYLAPGGRSAFTRIVLVPHRALWTVPLHCLTVAGRFLVDLEAPADGRVAVSYVHSSAILLECRKQIRSRTRHLLVVVHPEFESTVHDWVPRENAEIRLHAEPTGIVQRLNGGRQGEYHPASLDVHFATHGRFDRSDPAESYLDLGGKRLLTLAQLLLELKTGVVDCVFLAACSSGHVEVDASADYLGIATGFLKGGARNVIGTFWPVSWPVCAELERAYYRNRDQSTPCLALRDAVYEVRQTHQLSTWEWAAFYCLGAGAVENSTDA